MKKCFYILLFTVTLVPGKMRGHNPPDTVGTQQFLDNLNKFIYIKSDSVQPLIDSVIQQIDVYGPSKSLSAAYKLLSNMYMVNQEYDSSLNYLKKLQWISGQLNDNTIYGDYLFNMATLYTNKGLFDSAEYYYQQYYEIVKGEGDSAAMARYFMNMAALMSKKNDYDSSIYLAYQAEPWFVKQKNYLRLTLLYNTLGNDYMNIGNYQEAYKNLKKALENDSLTDEADLSLMIITNIAYALQNQQKYDQALKYYDQLMELSDLQNRPQSYNAMLLNLANIYYAKKDFKKALQYYLKVYRSPITARVTELSTAVTINLGAVYAELKQYDSALYFLQKGTALAEQNKLLQYLKNAYGFLYSIDTARGKWQDAVKALKKKYEINDSIINKEMMIRIEKMRIGKALEKEQLTVKHLKRENELQHALLVRRNYLIAVMAVAIVLILLLLIKISNSNRKILKLSNELKQKNFEIDKTNRELMATNKELERLNKLKIKFFSVISHDLRSPFNSLLGLTEMLQDESLEITEEERKEMIAALRGSVENVYELLEKLLEWSLVQMHGINPDLQKVDVKEVVDESMKLYTPMANNKEIRLESGIQKEVFVYADRRLVSNVVNNLINNALKFTNRKGFVRVEVTNKNGEVETCVMDNGVGIPQEKLKDIFSVASDTKTYGTEKEKGTGLGLSLCKEYVELMHGKIKVESTVGKGTTICFSLPSYQNKA